MTTAFWNILQVSLTTSLVLLPLLLLCAVLRRRYPARIVCALWVIFAVRLLVPVQNAFPDAPVKVTPRTTLVEVQAVPDPAGSPNLSGQTVDEQSDPAAQTPVVRRWMPAGMTVEQAQKTIAFDKILAGIWGVGAVLALAIALLPYFRFQRQVRRTARDVRDPALLDIYRCERERLGIRRNIPLQQTILADGPMLAGLFRPALLLPKDGIPLEDARLILRHELTHYKHRDLLWKLMFLLARCVHWFNPVAYLLAWQGAQDLEIACDQAVVRGLGADAKRQYGQCILNDVARRLNGGAVLTTRLTGGGKAMKTRLQALFGPNQKKRGISALLVVVFALALVGGCFAVTPKTGDSALEAEIRTAAEAYMQAIVDGDAQAVIDALPASVQETQDLEQAESALLLADPHVTAYAVYPDADRLGAYVVKNWSQALYSSLAAPDQHTVQWVQFIREDGVLKVNEMDGVAALCEKQATDLGTVRDLDTFKMLYDDLGLPDVGPAMLDDAAGRIAELLGLAGGQLEQQGETTFHYTFFNGQQISIRTKPVGDGWKFNRWTVVEKNAKPINGETQNQMEALAQRWCDAQVNGLSADQAKTLFGKDMLAMFDEYASWYADTDAQTVLELNDLPIGMAADKAEYTVNVQDGTVSVRVHGKPEDGVGQTRTWFSGITQVQTLHFGWQDDGLRIVDCTTDQAMILDDPDMICWTADDVIKMGMPEQPVASTSLEALVYLNFPVAGGRYRLANDVIAYDFADGTMIYFSYEKEEDSDSYRLTGVVEPENNEPQQSLTQFVPVIQAANQWAEGYLRENALFRYPFMSTALQQQFVQDQKQLGNGLRFFWKIGWGSSPNVTDWMLRDMTEDSVTVVYQLEAGGEQYRYAEKLTVDTQDGMPVVTGCEALQATWDDGLTREAFLQLYPDDVSALPINPDISYMRERSDKFQTPEDALCAAICTFYDEQTYTVTRAGEPITVSQGVDQDLKVTFPGGGEVYITMHQFTDEGGQKLWSVGRIWEGMPDHTT